MQNGRNVTDLQKKASDEEEIALYILESLEEVLAKSWKVAKDKQFYESDDWNELKDVIIKMIRISFLNPLQVNDNFQFSINIFFN